MTPIEMGHILSRVAYKDWSFVRSETNGGPYLQVRFSAPDPGTGMLRTQAGRKWLLSEHMTESELVQTCLLAVLTAEEHEAREHFHYQGRACFSPHFHVRGLMHLADASAHDMRAGT